MCHWSNQKRPMKVQPFYVILTLALVKEKILKSFNINQSFVTMSAAQQQQQQREK